MAENKKNYCDKDGQCTASCGEEMAGCRYYLPLKTMCLGMCTHLSKLGDHCLSPEAMTAKWKELSSASAIISSSALVIDQSQADTTTRKPVALTPTDPRD